MSKEEKRYIDCDRCGVSVQISGGGPDRVYSYTEYKNGTLCNRCAKIRNFDDNNPILYLE